MKTALFAVAVLGSMAMAAYPPPAGLWLFNDPARLTKSIVGPDLLESGTHTAVAGMNAGDGAVVDGIGSFFTCPHGIAPNGGGNAVNQWTLLLDIKLPAASVGYWVSLFQTNPANANDGDCFIATNRTLGVGATGYTAGIFPDETWTRVVISVSSPDFYRISVNGVKWLEGAPQPLDGRFALDPVLLLFADDSGEDYPVRCTAAALWGQALTDPQVSALGGPATPIRTAMPAEYVALNLLSNPSAEEALAGWTIADGADWQATDRTDWHFPRTGTYCFAPGRTSFGRITQTIPLDFLAAEIDSGIVVAKAGGLLGGADDDQARILVEYLDAADTLLTAADSGWLTGHAAADWLPLVLPNADGLRLPAGTRSARFSFLAQRLSGDRCDAYGEDFVWEYSLAPAGNADPAVPSLASSAASAAIEEDVAFMIAAADPDADPVSYQVDWGDGTAVWSDARPSAANYIVSHRWSVFGTYRVRARSRDARGGLSRWSPPLEVAVSGHPAAVFKSQPYLQNVSPDAITIAWETDRPVYPRVDWGLTAAYGSQARGLCIKAAADVFICKVRLTGLAPQTDYRFRARCGSTLSPDAAFKTAPLDAAPFAFAVWGDSQQETANPAVSAAMFADMAAAVDFGVAVGDVVQDAGASYFANPFRKYLCNIFARQKPAFVAFGNHDEPASSRVRKAIQNPGMQSFSFAYGNAHFTCIDYSQCRADTLPDDGSISSLPLAWLRQDLASDAAQNAAWRFLFIHVPPYSERWNDGSATLRAYLVPLLKQYRVHICFSGHVHEYQRGRLDGTYYIITGCGSYLDTPEQVVADWPHMTVGGSHNIGPFTGGCVNGYTRVEIDRTELTLTQHAYYADGTYYGLLDTVRIRQADFTRDERVDIEDLAVLARAWNTTPQDQHWNPDCDLADPHDRTIDLADLAEFITHWQFP